jgi:hypothetical protein
VGLAVVAFVIVVLTGFIFTRTTGDEQTNSELPPPLTTVIGAAHLVFDGIPQPLLDFIDPLYRRFRIAGGYGLFASMTTRRPEITVEGSEDGQTWKAYTFYFKADDLNRPPPFVAPYQPRLDWQMWFAALQGSYENVDWFPAFARRLLTGTPEVLALLQNNPFPDAPPRYVRARIMNYSFTDIETRNALGAWWSRGPDQTFLPSISLEDFGS